MTGLDRILVCVDGSDCALRAAKYGIELAKVHGASVDVLHVIERGRRVAREPKGLSKRRREAGEEYLDEVGDLAIEIGYDVDTHLEEGVPHRRITEYVRENDVDIVVMGRRGRSKLAERLLGGVTERVLRRTDRPVLTVPAAEGASGSAVERVLLPTDGSDNAVQAVPVGTEIAGQHSATIHVLTAVDVAAEAGLFDAGGVDREYIERLEADGQEDVDAAAERIRSADSGVVIETAVIRDTPHVAIREYVEENNIDLIVMASEGTSDLAGQVLGSVADRVLRTVDVPVLIIVI
ncbi:universal stress protein [Halostella sp. JP-L12]|uniref:universal stress protein n=1 Tax=Halostella TaxID=1843185 RepID=UPI0013CF1662|nr:MULTISPECIES: universal stress protein [Halostella]NHN49232.1 universal stress protein [Halostella sp. JP-L12]